MGLREDIDFTYFTEIPGTNELFHYDVTLSFSRIRQTYQGFEVFGDESDTNAIRIVALGGSTTECSLFYVKGWVRFLVDFLKNHGIPAVVYGGGVSSYTSSQELLKLIRDVIPLNPDIVISYSGVNDLYSYPKLEEGERYKRPFITRFQVQFIQQILERLTKDVGIPVVNAPSWNQLGHSTVFYGLKNNKTAAELWIDNERMMHSICECFGISFFAIYQPFRFNGCYQSSELQEIIHSRRDLTCIPNEEGIKRWGDSVKDNHEKIVKESLKYDFISDFSNIFEGHSELFYDTTHVYETGNTIIAEKIFNLIIPNLLKTRSKHKYNSIDLHLESHSRLDDIVCNEPFKINEDGIDYFNELEDSSNCQRMELKCGDHILFGENRWIILHLTDRYALILSENILTSMNYHNSLISLTWENSDLRRWLNTSFYNGFSETEKMAILPALTLNHNNPQFTTNGGNTTVDRIFLLSYDDVVRFLKINNSELTENTLSSWWWLRTPGIYSDRTAVVHEDGHVVIPGYYNKGTINNLGGVRPALLLSLKYYCKVDT